MDNDKSDSYIHQDSSIVYCETNIPGPGQGESGEVLCAKCMCQIDCTESCACIKYSGGSPNYTGGLLTQLPSALVLECNELCQCVATCSNRLVQHGPRPHLVVFQTDKRGWGLKTNVFINHGSFICEYAGEVIGREEAKRRAAGDSINYIFVLKEYFSGCVTETIVDPTCIGNIGRYINHSCEPNATVIPVRVDSPIPRLAIFAITNIGGGEEITYDYSNGGAGVGTTLCLCKSNKCRKFLPFDKSLLN